MNESAHGYKSLNEANATIEFDNFDKQAKSKRGKTVDGPSSSISPNSSIKTAGSSSNNTSFGDSIMMDDKIMRGYQKKLIDTKFAFDDPKLAQKELLKLRRGQRSEEQRWKGVLYIMIYGVVISLSYLVAKFLF